MSIKTTNYAPWNILTWVGSQCPREWILRMGVAGEILVDGKQTGGVGRVTDSLVLIGRDEANKEFMSCSRCQIEAISCLIWAISAWLIKSGCLSFSTAAESDLETEFTILLLLLLLLRWVRATLASAASRRFSRRPERSEKRPSSCSNLPLCSRSPRSSWSTSLSDSSQLDDEAAAVAWDCDRTGMKVRVGSGRVPSPGPPPGSGPNVVGRVNEKGWLVEVGDSAFPSLKDRGTAVAAVWADTCHSGN